MGYTLGLDLGVASVGWAVVNDEYEVVDSCSNIFSSADAAKNKERRDFREKRRTKRRCRTRISDFKILWEKSGFKVPDTTRNDVLKLRIKGISEKLEEDEIYAVLLNNLKHRGISYLEDAIEENSEGDYAKSIAYNEKQLREKLPCQIQYERLLKYGSYRGNRTVIPEGESDSIILSNVFTISAYRKEICLFLDKQIEYNSNFSHEFKNLYLDIFNRKREYYVGPGNELSRTDYGRYTTQIDYVTGKYITEQNIFDKLIGKCSVYKDEKRAAGASYTAQEFNALNDLNNLLVNERKLTEEEKRKIIESLKTAKVVNMRNIISSTMGEKIEMLSGARIDKNDKEIYHCFEAYNKIRKSLEALGVDIASISTDDLDIIGEILTLNTEKDVILSEFDRRGIELSAEVKECLIDVRKKNGKLFSKWQSFGLTIMKELIPEMYSQPKNQMQLLTDMGYMKTSNEKYRDCKNIPYEYIVNDIYNPVVCKTVKITVKVINAIIKKYGYPSCVVIEMPRDKNSEDEKKRITDIQKNNEKELQTIIDKIKKENGISITDKDFINHSKLALKLRLWNEQKGICPYSGKYIDIQNLLDDPFKYEVDHIIPLSISFDDSRSNKVLVYATENQSKGNRTPFAYLSNVDREWDFDEFMNYVLTTYKGKEKSKKRELLLYTDDITKISVLKGFINRNINDTRYASRVVLNNLQAFFKAKDVNTKVKVIRGSFTHQMRLNLKLEKDRNESYRHHAVDAMLIAYSNMGYEAYHKLTEDFIDYSDEEYIDKDGFDLILNKDMAYKENMYQKKWMDIKKNINSANVKYWYQVDKKCNRGLCNQNSRGTRIIDSKVVKINKLSIRTDDGIKNFNKLINSGKTEKLLIFKNNPKTFDYLMQIYKQYADSKNPFLEYEKDTGDKIRKYSKKHNGPEINYLKYEDGEVNSCIDISHKYGHKKDSRKVILESLNPYRMDVYYNINDDLYYFVGVKQSDIKCVDGKHVIDFEKYTNNLIQEKIIDKGDDYTKLEGKGFRFKLSFYRNEFIEYEKNGEKFIDRFLSKTHPGRRNNIEVKPCDASEFEGTKRKELSLAKTKSIRKVSLDILGNKYYVNEQRFVSIIE